MGRLSGVRNNHSCETARTAIIADWIIAIDNNEIVGTVFIELSKAFDLVDHERVGRKPSETDSIKFKISFKTPRGKKDSTKRHHHRHHKRQPGEQQFPIQVVTG